MKNCRDLVRFRNPVRTAIALAIATGLLPIQPAKAADGEWFRHPFGEIRAYYGDWLNVCPNEGRDPCRTVQIGLEPGETRVGPRRLALNSLGTGVFSIDVFHRGMAASGPEPVAFIFDGDALVLRPDQYRAGEAAHSNVAESLTVTDPALTADLIERMKARNRMVVTHSGGKADFSLRGVSAALSAIGEKQRNQQQ